MQQLEISDREYANSITTVQKDSMVAEKVIVREATKKGYAEAVEGDSVNIGQPNSKTRSSKMNNLRIRKLTPKECFRLMGFDDEDFYKAEAVNSNTQLYKQAGNSIVVDVLEAVFANLKPYLGEME